MKARIAKYMVVIVSRHIQAACEANHDGMPRYEKAEIWIANKLQLILFPLARRLDSDAMITQMIEESWWG